MESLESRSPQGAEEILAVFHDSYREEAKLLGLESFPPLERTAATVSRSTSEFLGLRLGSRLAAAAEIEELGADRIGIASFVVHPDFFRQGLGSRLLQGLLDRFPGWAVEVSTASLNLPAIRLYEKHGFRIVRRWRRGEGIDMVDLRRGRESERSG